MLSGYLGAVTAPRYRLGAASLLGTQGVQVVLGEYWGQGDFQKEVGRAGWETLGTFHPAFPYA